MWEDNDDDERPGTGLEMFLSGVFTEMNPLFRMEVTKDSVVIAIDLPGVKKKDVEITCTEDIVSVEAEIRKEVARRVSGGVNRSSRFERYSKKIALPVRVDPDRASARYRNGIVVVRLPILRSGKAIKIVDG